MDYVLADRFALPEALVPHYSERVKWLAGCFQPSDTQRAIPPAPSRAECGLPERTEAGGVVYCCFNNSYKLNPVSFDRMMAVLRGVPGSVLWLLSGPGRADERLREAARVAGVDPARLVFMRKLPHAEYLARYQHADLFLDTHPYNAHTTASDALWAGCPVLTCPGETFASRVAGSLNHHLGMEAMNATNEQSFIARAIQLGNDPIALATLREEVALLREQRNGLFDMAAFAERFISAAQEMRADSQS
jgi:predicted O-linked N-acetylglucosamine transferase (SPINDLY family)